MPEQTLTITSSDVATLTPSRLHKMVDEFISNVQEMNRLNALDQQSPVSTESQRNGHARPVKLAARRRQTTKTDAKIVRPAKKWALPNGVVPVKGEPWYVGREAEKQEARAIVKRFGEVVLGIPANGRGQLKHELVREFEQRAYGLD